EFNRHDPPVLSYFVRFHLHTHSFPTRRSSDLRSSATSPARSPSARRAISSSSSVPTTSARTGPSTGSCAASSTTWSWASTRSSRSEEHTSELQSRENLVCRLLLEKKKKTHCKI